MINLLMRIAFMTMADKMSMHSFDNGPFHVNAVRGIRMRREGVLREHTKTEELGQCCGCILFGIEYLKQYPQ